MTPETLGYINLAGIVAVIAFLWNLHRDIRALDRRISDLAERVAKLEGALEVMARNVDTLMRLILDRERPAAGE